MIIVGGRVEVSISEKLFFGTDIDKSNTNDLIFIAFKLDELALYKQYAKQNVPLIFYVSNITEFIYACNLGAKYAVAHKNIVCELQKTADNYLYDTRLLTLIKDENDIAWVAQNCIDGAIFECDNIKKLI